MTIKKQFLIGFLTLLQLSALGALAAGRIQNEDVKSIADIEAAAGTATANISSSTACLSSLSFSSGTYAGLSTGLFVYDTTTPANIASGTTIAGLPGTCSAGQIQISVNGGGTATGDTVTFGGQSSQLINDTKIWLTSTTPAQQLSTAITSNIIGGGGSGNLGINYLSNPSFEAGTSSWTTASATASVDTTNFVDGVQSILETMSSQAGELSQDVTPVTQLSGVNMQASCWVKTTQTNIEVCNRLAGADQNCQPVPATGTWQNVSESFIGPSSGSMGVSVKATSSDTGTFNVDACYVGKATNTAQVSQAQVIAQEAINGCSGTWTGTTQTWTTPSALTGCTYTQVLGSGTAPGTQIPAILMPTLAPGTYTLVYNGFYNGPNSSGNSAFRFTDGTVNTQGNWITMGTTNGTFQNTITYTTPQTNVTFQIQMINQNASNTCNLYGSNSGISGAPFGALITVYYTPNQQQAAYRPDATPASWSGTQSISGGGWSTTSNTFADVSAGGTVTLSQLYNRNFGTVSNASGSLPGITFTPPRAGRYLVRAGFQTAPQGGGTCSARLVDGSGNILDAGQSQGINNSGFNIAWSEVGIMDVAGGSPVTAKIQLQTNTGSTHPIVNNNPATAGISWSVVELDAPMPAPYLTGSVTTNASGVYHQESAQLGSGATIVSQSGSWVTSVANGSTGSYSLTIPAGEFSASPNCVASAQASSSSPGYCSVGGGLTSTNVGVNCWNSGGTLTNMNFNVMCQGPH